MRTYIGLLSALTFVLLTAVPVGAQSVAASEGENDSRWSPWFGCWRLTLESRDYDDEQPEGEVFVCLSPRANDMGVGVTTWADGEVVLTETLVADGTEYPVEESGCEGWRSADWSRDGRRLFMHSKLTCENAGARTVSGISMMVSGGTWVDIQLIVSGDRRELVIRRYYAADMSLTEDWEKAPQATPTSRTARLGAARALTVEDIIEASRKVDADVLEAILVESDTSIHVDSSSLLQLADSEVPTNIIDLMVALSYPEHFEIRSRKAVSGGIGFGYDDFFYDARYDPYGYWYPFYLAPFGYYSYAYWYHPGGYYLLTPSEDIKPASSGGKVIKGHGYARAWPKESAGKSGGTSSSGLSGSSSGGEASSQGYKSGSGGSSTGRTAKPRNKN